MTSLPYWAVALLLAALGVRYLWATYMKACWDEVVVLYANNVRASGGTIRDSDIVSLTQTWPTWQIVMRLNQRHYRSFIIDQAGVQVLVSFFEGAAPVKDSS